MLKRFIKKFRDLNISSKIVLYYLFVLIVSISFLSITYNEINNNIANNKVMQVSNEIVSNINSSIESLINTVDNQSKILISSQILQSALSNGNAGNYASYIQPMSKYLADFLNFNDFISSIYIFDNRGNEYFVDNVSYKNINLSVLKSADWYDKLISLRGAYILIANSGSLINDSKGNQGYVSFIRVINDVNSQKPAGFMIINISESYLYKYINSSINTYTSGIIIKDEKGNSIVEPTNISKSLNDEIFNYIKPNNSTIKKIDGKVFIISDLKNRFGWNIISITPFNELNSQFWIYNLILLLVIIINIILLILGLLFISLFITQPIIKLVNSMKGIKDGKFEKVNIITGNDEIGMLKDVYNKMIDEIKKLIGDIINEQKLKRKLELDVMQSQIKPHFLFNSFDAISALILMGDTKNASKIVKALGKFYRSFLINGNEEITIKEELDIINNYLTIQKIRFGDKFSVVMNIDERVLNYKIPKLILQPLVENALNHGVRNKEGQGIISIKALYGDNQIILMTEDNGKGMSEEKIKEIESGMSKGVGLKSTIERLKIYYNSADVVKIYSKIDEGTKIEITIPIKKEDQNDK
ncbi:integral membrane sensor signal transduction histidine kinase [Thermoanaerobacterium thermosaccharolyticum DSM 571]|uniref:histidine kinase n=1 Tax=Thermoanaerobacterium thermosaccharolyticum (strain ATCC 7956 / DSM 571 / NCIMB 9385 / NCA 3814 / NCTC 13789 / WDCM 00135 / 2032) TaxID=580327 RepID=D9TMZ3_THETC|nr:sensor histidine kinase [Thermoanaerobacterium thermosaccharolyticum]ADL68516.1 integral membrane sensor signal transduction histidine kinase [Thermoanaerobacterium thermosaccharolyticum DSM 571]MCP2239534.1 two-component system sensor histidine kinase YesM [Thermoanaerobacterium thermosaccharolyticum]